MKNWEKELSKMNSETFIGTAESKGIKKTMELAIRVAKFETSVLIVGETGVGKEVIARFIHQASRRSKNPFLAINCGALPETLLESELFGHKAGAFTGAIGDRIGVFEQAARGTILLDEIGEISPVIQIKLLRVLQEKEILKIGENLPRKIDTRIIASTNRDLDKAVIDRSFRPDLLFRLRIVEINVPPLRERPEDILPLINYRIKRLEKKLNLPNITVDQECLKFMRHYSWPGNVRELHNSIERAAIFSGNGKIKLKHLPPQVLKAKMPDGKFDNSPIKTLKDMEDNYIRYVLNSTGGNRTATAKILGIGQATLWRKLKGISI